MGFDGYGIAWGSMGKQLLISSDCEVLMKVVEMKKVLSLECGNYRGV